MENNQTFEEFYSTEGIRFIPDTNSHWHKEFMRFAWMSGYAKRQQDIDDMISRYNEIKERVDKLFY